MAAVLFPTNDRYSLREFFTTSPTFFAICVNIPTVTH